jgi:hypothetical protein
LPYVPRNRYLMFIYNITFKVEHSISEEWISWQKTKHIPEIMATLLFSEFRFLHLLNHDDSEGATYIIQYITAEKNSCDLYIKNYSPKFKDEAAALWGDKIVSFRSILASVQ